MLSAFAQLLLADTCFNATRNSPPEWSLALAAAGRAHPDAPQRQKVAAAFESIKRSCAEQKHQQQQLNHNAKRSGEAIEGKRPRNGPSALARPLPLHGTAQ